MANKVSKIQKVINNDGKKNKPKFNIITKGLLNKQVIITMSSNNSEKIMVKANAYVSNLNRFLKRVKSEYFVDFIYTDNKRLLITTNKVAITSNLNMIKKYIKDLNNIGYNDIESSKLSQSKLYFKILSISYFVEDTNFPILSELKTVNTNFFSFSLFWELRVRVSVMSHSHSHSHIITYQIGRMMSCIIYTDLKANI